MKKIINLLIVTIAFLTAQQVFGQEWVIPDGVKDAVNPSEYNIKNVKKGKVLYLQHCKSCHGDPGKNNSLPLVPRPPDITSEKMHLNTEAALFYKMTTGKGSMPQFETTISEDDRWRLVNYIMNYDPKSEPLLVETPPIKAKLLASVNEIEKTVEVFAEYENKGKFTKLIDVPIIISTKKYFGDLRIGEVFTDKNGRAEFAIPETLIGDEEGLVNIVVSLTDDYLANEVILAKAKVGKLKVVPKLIKKGEVIWSTNENIQIWMLLTYLGAVGAAWLTIGYVVFQIIKIKKLSKQ
ncbi:MAG: cytochrome c [Draconibacterium sp.]|nr:cytochrome c [Draconibacterium sp.]